MRIALSVAPLLFLVWTGSAVRITLPSTIVVGQSADITWDLDGGKFQSLDITLRRGGDNGPVDLGIINMQGKTSGVDHILFPADLTPAESYHVEALMTTPPHNFVGISPLFTLVAPENGPTSPSSQSQSATTPPTPPSTPLVQGQPDQTSSSSHTSSSSKSQAGATVQNFSGSGTTTTTSTQASGSVNPDFLTTVGNSVFSLSIVPSTQTVIDDGPAATNTSTSSAASSQSSSKTVTIVASVIGAVVGLAILVFVFVIFSRRHRKRCESTFDRERMVRTPGTGTGTPMHSSMQLPDYASDRASGYSGLYYASTDQLKQSPLSNGYTSYGYTLDEKRGM